VFLANLQLETLDQKLPQQRQRLAGNAVGIEDMPA
jgi:hypothetical protein